MQQIYKKFIVIIISVNYYNFSSTIDLYHIVTEIEFYFFILSSNIEKKSYNTVSWYFSNKCDLNL